MEVTIFLPGHLDHPHDQFLVDQFRVYVNVHANAHGHTFNGEAVDNATTLPDNIVFSTVREDHEADVLPDARPHHTSHPGAWTRFWNRVTAR